MPVDLSMPDCGIPSHEDWRMGELSPFYFSETLRSEIGQSVSERLDSCKFRRAAFAKVKKRKPPPKEQKCNMRGD